MDILGRSESHGLEQFPERLIQPAHGGPLDAKVGVGASLQADRDRTLPKGCDSTRVSSFVAPSFSRRLFSFESTGMSALRALD